MQIGGEKTFETIFWTFFFLWFFFLSHIWGTFLINKFAPFFKAIIGDLCKIIFYFFYLEGMLGDFCFIISFFEGKLRGGFWNVFQSYSFIEGMFENFLRVWNFLFSFHYKAILISIWIIYYGLDRITLGLIYMDYI
jgi:hypothetical protein